MAIGINIKAHRLKAGLTQVQLANATGINQGTIASYENNLQTPSAIKLAALAKGLNVSMETLMDPPTESDVQQEDLDHRIHGNSCTAQIIRIVPQLDLESQKTLLKHAKLLLVAHEAEEALMAKTQENPQSLKASVKTDSTPKRRRKAV